MWRRWWACRCARRAPSCSEQGHFKQPLNRTLEELHYLSLRRVELGKAGCRAGGKAMHLTPTARALAFALPLQQELLAVVSAAARRPPLAAAPRGRRAPGASPAASLEMDISSAPRAAVGRGGSAAFTYECKKFATFACWVHCDPGRSGSGFSFWQSRVGQNHLDLPKFDYFSAARTRGADGVGAAARKEGEEGQDARSEGP